MPSKKLKGKLAYVANPSSDDANGVTCFSGVGSPGDCLFLFDETLFESLEISVGVRRPTAACPSVGEGDTASPRC